MIKLNNFTESLCNKYYKSKELYILLNTLKYISNISIELFSKYYTRIYTEQDSYFSEDLNKDFYLLVINLY